MRKLVLVVVLLLVATLATSCGGKKEPAGQKGTKGTGTTTPTAAATTVAPPDEGVVTDVPKPKPELAEPGLPVLFSFETDASVAAWKTEKEDGIAEAVELSATTENATDGKRALKMLLKEHQWPGAYTETLATKDWSSYKSLQMDVTAEAFVSLAVRIDDVDSSDYESRFQLTVDLDKGKNTVKIILDDVADVINLKKIKRLTLFSGNVTENTVFVIDNIRLEK